GAETGVGAGPEPVLEGQRDLLADLVPVRRDEGEAHRRLGRAAAAGDKSERKEEDRRRSGSRKARHPATPSPVAAHLRLYDRQKSSNWSCRWPLPESAKSWSSRRQTRSDLTR